ncbi:methylated-DNA--[protein]-cysteine S-methyltransferase [Thermodesulfobacteriota bacterium]
MKFVKDGKPDLRPETFYMKFYHSPLGAYVLVSSKRGVVGVKSDNRRDSLLARWEKNGIRIENDSGQNDAVERELDAYFTGKLVQFKSPLDLRGTVYQLRVWQELQAIPYGETRTYGQVASSMGQPTASRAVGGANNKNPIAIIVPCHRVIGADGGLVGYAGGLDRKKALLDLEACVRRKETAM